MNTTFQPMKYPLTNSPADYPQGQPSTTVTHELARKLLEQIQSGSSDVTSETISVFLSALGRASKPVTMADAWLSETLKTISSFRDVKNGWDGRDAASPPQKALDAAEMLSALLSSNHDVHRLSLMVGPDGKPSFATALNDFYVHLVVEPGPAGSNHQVGNLSWYTVRNGIEDYQDDIPFDGQSLPEPLKELVEKV